MAGRRARGKRFEQVGPVRRRVGVVAALSVAVLLAVPSLGVVGASAAGVPGPSYRVGDYADGGARSILPAGENGLVNPAQLLQFEATGTRPPGSDDQLGPYSNLIYGAPSLTDANLGDYFNDESFGVRTQDVTKVERSNPDVTIYR